MLIVLIPSLFIITIFFNLLYKTKNQTMTFISFAFSGAFFVCFHMLGVGMWVFPLVASLLVTGYVFSLKKLKTRGLVITFATAFVILNPVILFIRSNQVLCHSVLNSRPTIAKASLIFGGQINYVNKEGLAPIHFAIMSSDQKMINLVLANNPVFGEYEIQPLDLAYEMENAYAKEKIEAYLKEIEK